MNKSKFLNSTSILDLHQKCPQEDESIINHLVSSLNYDFFKPPHKQELLERFIDALTFLASLPCDDIGMSIRYFVVKDHPQCVSYIAKALAFHHPDIRMKCKAANAIGSLCMSTKAGELIISGNESRSILSNLLKMLSCSNIWAKGDACFVLGWFVNAADASFLSLIQEFIHPLVELANNFLLKYLDQDNEVPDKDVNIRIYSAISILKITQRFPILINESETMLAQYLMNAIYLFIKHLEMIRKNQTIFQKDEFGIMIQMVIAILWEVILYSKTLTMYLLQQKALHSITCLQNELNKTQLDQIIAKEQEVKSLKEKIISIQHKLVSTFKES